MSDAEDLLARYLQAQQDKDLDALVSCWHPDVEVVHPMRPDRNWSGLDTYRRQWKLIWELRYLAPGIFRSETGSSGQGRGRPGRVLAPAR